MLEVPIDRIISVTDARNSFNKIVEDVETGEMYILTKGGSPSVAIISVQELEKLTGNKISNTPKPPIQNRPEPTREVTPPQNQFKQSEKPNFPTHDQPSVNTPSLEPKAPSAPSVPHESNSPTLPRTESGTGAPQSFLQRNASLNQPKPPITPLAGPSQSAPVSTVGGPSGSLPQNPGTPSPVDELPAVQPAHNTPFGLADETIHNNPSGIAGNPAQQTPPQTPAPNQPAPQPSDNSSVGQGGNQEDNSEAELT